ncbi:binding partner of ACD11 1 [Brachypodium distachyon]|uniref:binding partner of ACD11 1 n=1 Tax=Brachypodium distachyon TaxID=15368 RepID=UPI000D0D1D6C|nr:binding partner of ACD11 1 [Brachypodium distachyon]|eukprot:XP_024310335.1 binding partner of ACD11 1 [Brachypodium distachyon]
MQESFMAVRLAPGCLRVEVAPRPDQFSSSSSPQPSPQLRTSPSWTIDVPNARTIKVTNISGSATADNIKEFFSFSGDIEYVEMRRESETSQVAYVTFEEFHGADTALLLSGASISDASVNITPVEDYDLPPEAYTHAELGSPRTPTEAAVKKAEEVVSTMLARGFVLSKDALKRARSFDDRHQLLSSASARVARLDRRFGLSDKFTLAVRGVDERLQVSERARGAITTAETIVASSPYASRGAAWVSAAVGAVARAAADVGAMTMDKVESMNDDGVDSATPPAAAQVHAVQVDDVARAGACS